MLHIHDGKCNPWIERLFIASIITLFAAGCNEVDPINNENDDSNISLDYSENIAYLDSGWVPFRLSHGEFYADSLVTSAQLNEPEIVWRTTFESIFYGVDVEEVEDTIHVWPWGLMNPDGPQSTIPEVGWKRLSSIFAMPSHDFLFAVHWDDTTTTHEVSVSVILLSTDPEWVNYLPSEDGVIDGYRYFNLLADDNGTAWIVSGFAVRIDGTSINRYSSDATGGWLSDNGAGVNPEGTLFTGPYGATQLITFDGTSWDSHVLSSATLGEMTAAAFDTSGNALLAYWWRLFLENADGWDELLLSGDNYSSIQAMVVDDRNTIWFAGEGSGVGYITNNTVTVFNDGNSNLPVPIEGDFLAIAVDSKGIAYAVNESDKIFRTDGSSIEVFSAPFDGLTDYSVTDLAIDAEDGLWFATSVGLIHYSAAGVRMIYDKANSGLLSDEIVHVAIDGLGRIWTASPHLGITLFKNGH